MFRLYSKQNCPNCVKLKAFIEMALADEFDASTMEIVMLEDLTEKEIEDLGFFSVPVLENKRTGETLEGFQPGLVRDFLVQ